MVRQGPRDSHTLVNRHGLFDLKSQFQEQSIGTDKEHLPMVA